MAEYGQTVLSLINGSLAAIRAEQGTSGPLFSTALGFFNDALKTLSMEENWRWARKESSVATVASTKNVLLADDVLRVNKVWVDVGESNPRLLGLLEEDEARILYPNDADEGSPEAYISGIYDFSTTTIPPKKALEIKPTPDTVYTLNYSYQGSIKEYTTSPDNTTDYPPIPVFLYPALRQLIKIDLLAFMKNSRREIEQATTLYAFLVDKAKKFDRDMNKGNRSIRFPLGLSTYRQDRYNF
jgi:hypothetical protein